MKVEPHHFHISFILIIKIILVIALVLLIKPALLGYKIDKQFEEMEMKPSDFLKTLDSLRSEKLIAETKLDSCTSLNQEFMLRISEERNNSLNCARENEVLDMQANLKTRELEFNLTRLSSYFDEQKKGIDLELQHEKDRYSKLEEDYNTLAKSAAENMCCKARVDDKKIDSYTVSNNLISCSYGEDNKIAC